MKVLNFGKWINMEVGQEVLVGHCGSGRTVFGEPATLAKVTERYLVFKTESGAVIKTASDNLANVIGKAGKQGNWVSTHTEIMDSDEFIKSPLFVY